MAKKEKVYGCNAVTTSQVLRETKSLDAHSKTESSMTAMVATSSTRMERRSSSGQS